MVGAGRMVAAVLVLAAAGCSSNGDGSRSVESESDPLSMHRPGYPPNGPGIGDPAALMSEPGSADPVSYRGVPVVQACDLVTPEDLGAAAGLLLVPATATGLVQRNYLDGQGSTELPTADGGVHTESNTCHYVVGPDTDRASVTVHVHQTSYVDPDALARELRYDYRPSGSIGPVEVLQPLRTMGEFATPWLRYRDVSVQLILGPFPEQVTARFVEAIAARLPAVVARPGGPRRFGYRSPIFPVDYVNACEISAGEDFQAVFGIPPSPSVLEGVSPSVGRIEFTAVGGISANYVAHECRRHSTARFTDTN